MPTTANGIDTAGLNPQFSTGLNGLISAVEQQGGHVTLSSGVRTKAEQQRLYDNRANNSNPVATPGTSLHERGLAADVNGDAKTMSLLHQLAPQYGLTGIDGDPVHFQLANADNIPTGNGLNPTTPAAPKALSLPDRMGVLAAMLNTHGAASTQVPDATTATALGPNAEAETSAQFSGTESQASGTDSTAGGTGAPSSAPPATATTAPAQSAGGIDAFMASIAHQESGGNYNATNNTSGAHGKYQIMPSNWSAWAKEAGLPADAQQTPQNQEVVAKAKIQQYYQQFGGDWSKVAKAWYGGPGSVDKNVSGGAGYPDSNTYANQVTAGVK